MGRRSKLTPETVAKVAQAIKAGATRRLAAEYAGVGESTLLHWLAATTKATEPLRVAVQKAEADSGVAALARIQTAAQNGDWKAAAWILEHRFPNEYGRRSALAVAIAAAPVPTDYAAMERAAQTGIGATDAAVLWRRQLDVTEAAYRAGQLDAGAYLSRLDRLSSQAARLADITGRSSPTLTAPEAVLRLELSSEAVAPSGELPADVPESRRAAGGGDAIEVG